ncbi:Glutathione S-transferase GST-6.0 [Nymphon striatum]|nr:Glutathione S-transferase GST-6.0 [Nymphon striatum]
MSHITLIRHGQANSGAKDELSYDKLSNLGHEQAGWLGGYLQDSETHHTRLFTGTLVRHIETADGMQTGLEPVRDARLNELEYFTMAKLLEEQHAIDFPTEQGAFTTHLPTVFQYWRDGKIEGTPETWNQFHTRVDDALNEIAAGSGPALVEGPIMMKLYFATGTISVAVAITLEEAGLPYEPLKVDFSKAEQTKPDYLKLNPKGRVPALVTKGGTILTETGALLDYIAALQPDAGLIPQDAEDAAHMRSVMYYLASTMHIAHAHKMRGSRWADQQSSYDDMAAKVPQTMTTCAEYVQTDCLRGDFTTGDSLTIADPISVCGVQLAGR